MTKKTLRLIIISVSIIIIIVGLKLFSLNPFYPYAFGYYGTCSLAYSKITFLIISIIIITGCGFVCFYLSRYFKKNNFIKYALMPAAASISAYILILGYSYTSGRFYSNYSYQERVSTYKDSIKKYFNSGQIKNIKLKEVNLPGIAEKVGVNLEFDFYSDNKNFSTSSFGTPFLWLYDKEGKFDNIKKNIVENGKMIVLYDVPVFKNFSVRIAKEEKKGTWKFVNYFENNKSTENKNLSYYLNPFGINLIILNEERKDVAQICFLNEEIKDNIKNSENKYSNVKWSAILKNDKNDIIENWPCNERSFYTEVDLSVILNKAIANSGLTDRLNTYLKSGNQISKSILKDKNYIKYQSHDWGSCFANSKTVYGKYLLKNNI